MNKGRKNIFKKSIGKIHLWLGLLSGIIVFIVSLTGCIFVFNQEFTSVFRKDILYVKPQEKTIPLSQLWENTQQQIGKNTELFWVNTSNNSEKSWVFYAYKPNNDPGAITYFESLDYYKSVYVNPYTGEILRIYDEKMDFFNIVKMLHWSLLLKDDYGKPIVGYATLIFVLMLITGFILWWPKNRAARKQRFSFKWKSGMSWKRKNYDIHSILGFYIGSVAMIISLTGLVWAFTWMQSLVYIVGSLSLTPPDLSIATSTHTESRILAMDKALAISKKLYPEASTVTLTPPFTEPVPPFTKYAVILVSVQQYDGLYYVHHHLQFDQYTGELLKKEDYQDKNFGEKLIDANYDIHVGAILGFPGKVLAFIVSLICASLPLTGFLIWRGRRRRKKQFHPIQ